MTETWLPIPGYDGYEVSDQGRVRSYHKPGIIGPTLRVQRILKPGGIDRPMVQLRRNGSSYAYRVASLVLLAFVGDKPSGMEVCHNNGDPADDRLENLRYDTHQANMDDYNAIMAARAVEIRQARADGASYRQLAHYYNLSIARLKVICRGKDYLHAGGPIEQPPDRLTKEELFEILDRYEDGEYMASIGADYGRSESSVSYIVNGHRYKEWYQEYYDLLETGCSY